MSKYGNDLSSDIKDDVVNETSVNQQISEVAPDFFEEDTALANKENLELFKGILKEEWNIAKEFMGMVEKAGNNQFG